MNVPSVDDDDDDDDDDDVGGDIEGSPWPMAYVHYYSSQKCQLIIYAYAKPQDSAVSGSSS